MVRHVVALIILGILCSAAGFAVESPAYTVVPLEPGNHWQSAGDFDAVAGVGWPIVFGGDPREPARLRVLDEPGVPPRTIELPLAGTTTEQISEDGRWLFFNHATGLARIDLRSGASAVLVVGGPRHGQWGMDRTGSALAYLGAVNGSSDGQALFLLDVEANALRRVTDPSVRLDGTPCTGTYGVRPLLSDDGSVLIYVAAAPSPTSQPTATQCEVWMYDVAAAEARVVTTLPDGRVAGPALDAAAQYYTFTLIRLLPSGDRRSDPVLVDLRSDSLIESLTGDERHSSFDALISGDGRRVVLSSMADLDSSVGNTDHNMETFIYDIRNREFTQVTNTSGGIEPGVPGPCSGYSPEVARDGMVIVWTFGSTELSEECVFRQPHRHRSTGLYYRFARTVRKRPGNRPAVLTGLPATIAARPEQMLELRAAATDPDGDPITFFAQEVSTLDVPRGAEIEDHYDGRATLRWRPRLEQAGEYTVRFVAFDEGGGETQQDVLIRVGGAGGDDRCIGDCDDDGLVDISELVTAVEAGLRGGDDCAAADGNGDGQVTVDELIGATVAALYGCP